MLYKNTNRALAITLLLVAGSAGASAIPDKKRNPKHEIKTFENLINNSYRNFHEKTILDAWWPVRLGAQIDPKSIALAAYIYHMLYAYKKCVECLDRAGTDAEFLNYQEKFNDAKQGLLKLDAPQDIKTHITSMETALWSARAN